MVGGSNEKEIRKMEHHIRIIYISFKKIITENIYKEIRDDLKDVLIQYRYFWLIYTSFNLNIYKLLRVSSIQWAFIQRIELNTCVCFVSTVECLASAANSSVVFVPFFSRTSILSSFCIISIWGKYIDQIDCGISCSLRLWLWSKFTNQSVGLHLSPFSHLQKKDVVFLLCVYSSLSMIIGNSLS